MIHKKWLTWWEGEVSKVGRSILRISTWAADQQQRPKPGAGPAAPNRTAAGPDGTQLFGSRREWNDAEANLQFFLQKKILNHE